MTPTKPAATETDVDLRAFDPRTDMAFVAAMLRATNEHDRVEWRPTETTLAEEWVRSERFEPEHDVIVANAGDEVVGVAITDWRRRG